MRRRQVLATLGTSIVPLAGCASSTSGEGASDTESRSGDPANGPDGIVVNTTSGRVEVSMELKQVANPTTTHGETKYSNKIIDITFRLSAGAERRFVDPITEAGTYYIEVGMSSAPVEPVFFNTWEIQHPRTATFRVTLTENTIYFEKDTDR